MQPNITVIEVKGSELKSQKEYEDARRLFGDARPPGRKPNAVGVY
jgi:hypothetical protein